MCKVVTEKQLVLIHHMVNKWLLSQSFYIRCIYFSNKGLLSVKC